MAQVPIDMNLTENIIRHVFQDTDFDSEATLLKVIEESSPKLSKQSYEKRLHSSSISLEMEPILLCRLALFDFVTCEYELSLDKLESALSKAKETKQPQIECAVLYGLGQCYLHLRRYKDAVDTFHELSGIARHLEDFLLQTAAHCSLAKTYASQNEYGVDKAVEELEFCSSLSSRNKHISPECLATVFLLNAQARIYLARYADAEQQLRCAKKVLLGSCEGDISIDSQLQIWLCLAQIHFNIYDQATALSYVIQVIDSAVSNTIKGDGFVLLSSIYFKLGCPDLGFRCVDMALEIFEMLDCQMKQFEVNLHVAYSYLEYKKFDVTQLNQLEAADVSEIVGYLQEATIFIQSLQMKLTDDKHKLAFSDRSREASELLQMIYINRGDGDTALFCAESTRSNSLISWIESRFKDDPAKRQIFKFISASVSTLGMLEVLKEACDTAILYSYIRNRLFDGFIVWIFHLYSEDGESESIVSKVIPCPYHKLESTITKLQRSIAMKSRQIRIQGRDAFEGERNALKEDFEEDEFGDLPESNVILRELYSILLGPIEKDARVIRENHKKNGAVWRLMIIPNSDLFLVPFPALLDSTGNHLCKIWKVSIVPSLKLLSHLRGLAGKEGSERSTFLVIGNPATPPEATLCDLPGAEREARNVAALFPGADLLVRSSARKGVVMERMKAAQVIHFACHGSWKESFLAMASISGAFENGSKPESYRLTAGDIAGISLKAGLVVLSACNSGRGRVTGEGIDGLARAFFLAGARAVLVALWQLPDDATESIMTSFYKSFKGGLSAASALRQAMESGKQNSKDPFYWAAFYLMGEDVYYSDAVPEWLLLGHASY